MTCCARGLLLTLVLMAPQALADDKQKDLPDQRPPDKVEWQSEYQSWLKFYYADPKPALTPDALRVAEGLGVLKEKQYAPPLMAFFAEVFAANEDQVPAWLEAMSDFSGDDRKFLWNVLWYSESPALRGILEAQREQADDEGRAYIEALLRTEPLNAKEVRLETDAQVSMLLASFYATGDVKPLERAIPIMDVKVKGGDFTKVELGLNTQAIFIGAAAEHPRIMKLLERARAKASGDLKGRLDEALERAVKLRDYKRAQSRAAATTTQPATQPAKGK